MERGAQAYLARLLEVNSHRLTHDFIERLSESRRQLEQALRDRLHALSASAQRVLDHAAAAQAAGAEAMQSQLETIARLRADLVALEPPARVRPARADVRPE